MVVPKSNLSKWSSRGYDSLKFQREYRISFPSRMSVLAKARHPSKKTERWGGFCILIKSVYTITWRALIRPHNYCMDPFISMFRKKLDEVVNSNKLCADSVEFWIKKPTSLLVKI